VLLQTTIVAEDWSGTIEIRSTLDGNVTNSLVERYRDLASDHLDWWKSGRFRQFCAADSSDDPIAHSHCHGGANHRVARRDSRAGHLSAGRPGSFEIGHDIAVELSAGQSLTVEKIVTLFTGRDVATSNPLSMPSAG
jgi:alpha,alpha-trehalase